MWRRAASKGPLSCGTSSSPHSKARNSKVAMPSCAYTVKRPQLLQSSAALGSQVQGCRGLALLTFSLFLTSNSSACSLRTCEQQQS